MKEKRWGKKEEEIEREEEGPSIDLCEISRELNKPICRIEVFKEK